MQNDRSPETRDRPRVEAVVGRYMLCDEIAAGGMATVHIGRLLGPIGFARTVAIKRLHAHFARDPEFVAMFLDEARIAARVRHPNVVSTIDVVALEGEMLVVMEYVHGEALSRLVRASRAKMGQGVPPAIALSVIAGALYGLHAAHEARDDFGAALEIVHRDVSPQNILVGQDGIPRVVDFGVAKATGRLQNTREGTLKGKLAYMSPEQVAADRVDRRTDIYAASVVLWELLAGQRLFIAENDARVLHALLHAEVAPPSRFSPGISPAIDALVLKGLARDPDARFATAAEMAEALQQAAFATPGQISAWVKDLGGDALALREARVVEIESTSSASAARPGLAGGPPAAVDPRAPPAYAPPMAAPSAEAPGSQVSSVNVTAALPARSRAPLVLAALAPVLVATLLGGGLLIARQKRAAARAAAVVADTEPPASIPPPAAKPSIEPSNTAPSALPTELAAEPAPAPTASAEPSAVTSSSASSAPKPAATAPKPSAKKANCNPPYRVDARGVRVPKMECL